MNSWTESSWCFWTVFCSRDDFILIRTRLSRSIHIRILIEPEVVPNLPHCRMKFYQNLDLYFKVFIIGNRYCCHLDLISLTIYLIFKQINCFFKFFLIQINNAVKKRWLPLSSFIKCCCTSTVKFPANDLLVADSTCKSWMWLTGCLTAHSWTDFQVWPFSCTTHSLTSWSLKLKGRGNEINFYNFFYLNQLLLFRFWLRTCVGCRKYRLPVSSDGNHAL